MNETVGTNSGGWCWGGDGAGTAKRGAGSWGVEGGVCVREVGGGGWGWGALKALLNCLH